MVTNSLVQKKKVGSTNSEFPQKTESQDLPHGLGWLPSTGQPQPKTKPKGGTSKKDVGTVKPNIIVKPPIAPPTGNNEFGFPVPQKF